MPAQPQIAPSDFHRLAFDRALDAILVAYADGRQLDANNAALDLFGYRREELLRLSNDELLALEPDWLAEAEERFADGNCWQHEATLRGEDGRPIDAAVHIYPIWSAARKLLATVALVRDVTAQRSAEAELAATHQYSRDVLERMSDGFYALDRDWRFTYVNQAAERIMARPREELLAAVAWDAFPPALATSIFADLGAVRESGISTALDYYYPPYDRWLAARVYPSERGLAIYFHDATARKRAEQDTAAALEAARAAQRAQSRFMALLSRELRTPLQAVLGYADLLLSGKADPLTRAQHADLHAIRDGAGRMAALVEQALDLARISSGALELVSEPVDLAQVLEQVHHDLAGEAASRGLALQIDLPSDLPAVLADPLRLHQILHHLTSNAIKFTEKGSVRISVRETSEELVVAVRDTGIGIASEELPHVFEAFRQAENGAARRGEGARLGLAVARRLAKRMGGSISVASQPNVGSRFALHFPISRTVTRQMRTRRSVPGW